MGNNGGFHYALQPILLTRQWALDRLRMDLAESNVAWSEQDRVVRGLLQRQQASMDEWNGLNGATHSVDSFMRLSRYIDDCGRQVKVQQRLLDELAQHRDALIDQVCHAQQALEAMQKHRQEMQSQFRQARASLDFKDADDQWGMSRPRGVLYEHES